MKSIRRSIAVLVAVGLLLGTAILTACNATVEPDAREEELQTALVRQGNLVLFASGSGSASTNALDEASLTELASRVAEIMALGPERDEIPILTQSTSLTGVASLDQAVIEQTPQARAEAVRQVCEAAAQHDQEAYGAYLVETSELAVANSEGHFSHHAGRWQISRPWSGTMKPPAGLRLHTGSSMKSRFNHWARKPSERRQMLPIPEIWSPS